MNPGDIFAKHYAIKELLGQGGMGEVYRAYDQRLDRDVAIKVISDTSAEASARLIREARAAAALDHPNVVSVFDIGEDQGTPYIVMELVPGRTLRALIDNPTIPDSTRVGWLVGMAKALAVAHHQQLVHRDVKPENVMVRPDGTVKMLDFGIARRFLVNSGVHQSASASLLTQAGTIMGTPLYMAPEQIRNQPVDHRTDQFAWGVVAYELLTGRVPWQGKEDPLASVASVLTDEVDPRPLAKLPPTVQKAILRSLSKQPAERFASMDELCLVLEGQLASVPPPSPGHSTGQRRGIVSRRYTTHEMRSVLERAIDIQAFQATPGRFHFEEILAAAEEMGIDPATLHEASQGLYIPGIDDEEQIARWMRGKRRTLFRHAGAFVCVNGALISLGLLISSSVSIGILVPGLLWGIGLGIHMVNVITSDADEWRDERRRKLRIKKNRNQNPELDRAANELLRTTSQLRKTLSPTPRLRVVPTPTNNEVALKDTEAISIGDLENLELEQSRKQQRHLT
jgi:eukaryotic-like serine/threonine-protein kinase